MGKDMIARIFAILLACSAPASGETRPESFCERLAPALGMKHVKREAQSASAGTWEVNLLRGLGPALFGGSAVASFAVHPTVHSASEYQRLEDSCLPASNGAVCRVMGPARLTVGLKGGKVEVDALPGEQAEVSMRTTVITCRGM